ncbi:hypothetical protein Cadr_000015939 [Camelus dromedarius]|uniref:Uncharacterized protein n=1 Tax=Camelus dromedarius TaxID=9838 RepID=A0A5N4E8S8_CAMDR|nr:hypothetical protein Cadr_000015939 [Camelus dromedarius]
MQNCLAGCLHAGQPQDAATSSVHGVPTAEHQQQYQHRGIHPAGSQSRSFIQRCHSRRSSWPTTGSSSGPALFTRRLCSINLRTRGRRASMETQTPHSLSLQQ